MLYESETVIPRENEEEAKILFDVAEKVPPEKLYGFIQFLRGIGYGLELGNGLIHSREV